VIGGIKNPTWQRGGFFYDVRPAWAHTCGSESRCELVTVSLSVAQLREGDCAWIGRVAHKSRADKQEPHRKRCRTVATEAGALKSAWRKPAKEWIDTRNVRQIESFNVQSSLFGTQIKHMGVGYIQTASSGQLCIKRLKDKPSAKDWGEYSNSSC